VLHNTSGTFFWLDDPANAGAHNFYGVTTNCFCLYRTKVTKEILETGVFGTIDYTLP